MAIYWLIRINLSNWTYLSGKRLYSNININTNLALEYKRCYQILGIAENSDQEQIRRAYLSLVKKYHPDGAEGDLNMFQQVDKAFRTLINKKSRERWDVEEEYNLYKEVEEQDIKHTAPQHRQYLSYGGAGSGTPFQREKQYSKMRATQAANNVLQHRLAKATAEEKTLMDKKVPFKHKIKTTYGFDRLVEDLIQESMSKGEFNNLSGCGKPLQQQNLNPYVDFVTHKINQVLIENGFTPEWITLLKEIREDSSSIKENLIAERQNYGPHPLSPEDSRDWDKYNETFIEPTRRINKRIDHFNLVVPVLNKQMLLLDLNKMATDILKNGKYNFQTVKREKSDSNNNNKINNDNVSNIFSFFDVLFKK